MGLLCLIHYVFTETLHLILGLFNIKSISLNQLSWKESENQVDSVVSVVMTEADSRSLSALERLRRLFSSKVVEAEDPATLFYIPVFIRRDGSVLRVGGTARLKNKKDLFVIKDILISYDLEKAYVNLISKADSFETVNPAVCSSLEPDSPAAVSPEEELIMVEAAHLFNISGTDLCRDLALSSMARIQRQSVRYPIHILRSMRKHQLCSGLRRDVQRFLAGFSMAKAWSLGPVDWRLDPGILGLEVETGFSLDFHVEKVGDTVSHLDLLLGEGWDVRQVANSAGYRAVLTLELGIDPCIQYIRIQAHAVLCPEELDQPRYRSQTMGFLKRAELSSALGAAIGEMGGLKSCDVTRNEVSFAPLGTAKSLTWEEFDNPYDFNLSSEECSPQRLPPAQQQQQVNAFDSCEPSTSTAHTRALQDILQKADFNSQSFYYYSPVSSRTCKRRNKQNFQDGPHSTSTPEEESAEETLPDLIEESAAECTNIEEIIPKFINRSSVANLKEQSTMSESLAENLEPESKPDNTEDVLQVEINSADHQVVTNDKSEELDAIGENIPGAQLENTGETETHLCEVPNCSGVMSTAPLDNNNTQVKGDMKEKCDSFPNKSPHVITSSNCDSLQRSPSADPVIKSHDYAGSPVHPITTDNSVTLSPPDNSATDPSLDNSVTQSSCDKSVIGDNSVAGSPRGTSVTELPSDKLIAESLQDNSVTESPRDNLVTESLCDTSVIESPRDNLVTQSLCDTSVIESPRGSSMTLPREIVDCDEDVRTRVSEYISSIEHETLTLSPIWMKNDQEDSVLTPPSLKAPTTPSASIKRGFISPHSHRSRSLTDVSKDGFTANKNEELDDSIKDRDRLMSDEANVSVCSSRSRASRTSRASEQLAGLTGRINQGAVSSMYGVGISGQLVTPFPDDWQYNTIPEVIENDDEID